MKAFFLVLVLFTVIIGCDSKFVEKPPKRVPIKGLSLDDRLEQKERIDGHIEQLEAGAKKINRIIQMFRNVQDPEFDKDIYSPIDFIIDLNAELKTKIPKNEGNKVVRYGQIELPLKGLSEECKVVYLRLETEPIYNESKELGSKTEATLGEKEIIGERLTYFFKSCASDDKYIVAIVAEWVGISLEFKLNNENLNTLFKDILTTEIMNSPECKVTQNKKKIVEKVRCKNLHVSLSKSETALVRDMLFSNSGVIRFQSSTDIYENNIKKATSEIKVFDNGDIDFDLEKIEQAVPPQVQAI
ncbi:MAG: hypothetical protein HOO06_03620 [Bdellovibrionaceae bacterium]|jgi:hypothetical protein|nr:hypothetical protein [Pseudobdellovibrionaceae bacterium]